MRIRNPVTWREMIDRAAGSVVATFLKIDSSRYSHNPSTCPTCRLRAEEKQHAAREVKQPPESDPSLFCNLGL